MSTGPRHPVDRTTVLCPLCRGRHEAAIERDGGKIVGRISCPRGERIVELSSDAEIYLAIRAKAGPPAPAPPANRSAAPGRSLINVLDVTNTCNLRCPVCAADCGPNARPEHLPPEAAAARARRAADAGARAVTLAGGEPTLHPLLPAVIEAVRGAGLRVLLATNGLRLAAEPAYARRLKAAGLHKVSLQFDSLDAGVLEQIRGTRAVDAKIAAANNVIRSGLRLGLITTVTGLNVAQTGRIVEFGLSLAPALSSMVFQAASPVGRYELAPDTLVDRERIIRSLLDSRAIAGASLADVWPLPRFGAWGLALHPDCAANVILTVDSGRVGLLGELVDLARLHARLAGSGAGPSWMGRNIVPLRHALAAARPRRRGELLRCLWGAARGSRRRGLVVIGMGAFLNERFQDEGRLAGCGTSLLTEAGPVSPCRHYASRGCYAP